jgi:hypothetical protein
VINNREMYKEFVIGDLSYRLPIYYYVIEHLMSTDGMYAGHVELECIIQIKYFECIVLMILLNGSGNG